MVTKKMALRTLFIKMAFLVPTVILLYLTDFNGSTILYILAFPALCSAVYDTILVKHLSSYQIRNQPDYHELRLRDAFKVNKLILIIIASSFLCVMCWYNVARKSSRLNSWTALILVLAIGFSLPLVLTTPIVFGIAILIRKLKRPASPNNGLQR